jgi:hypothetical protein
MHHRLPDWAMWTFLLLLLAAVSLPMYARIARHYEAVGAPLSPVSHVLAVLASALAGIVVVFLIMAVPMLVVIAVDYLRQKIRR